MEGLEDKITKASVIGIWTMAICGVILTILFTVALVKAIRVEYNRTIKVVLAILLLASLFLIGVAYTQWRVAF